MQDESIDTPDFALRLRSADRSAFEEVVRRYLQQVHRTARGAGLNRQQADDLTQATFVAFFEAAPRFEGRSTVRTFLLGILYRKLQEARRGFHKDRRHDDIDEVVERRFDEKGGWTQPPRAADHSLYDQEIVEHTARCLETVPERQKLAFLLREVEGLSTQETCNALEVSVTNLGVMLYRARNRLRECLEKQGIFGAA